MTRKILKLTLKILLCLLSLSLSVIADQIDDLMAGQWVELSCQNTIRDVLPDPVPLGNSPNNIIEAWNSGCFDTMRKRYIIHGGGHSDYQGNEIYGFDLTTLAWSRLTDPSNSPTAVHTYDTLEYLPREDWFFRQGGCGWGPDCPTTNEAWAFDFGPESWMRLADHPNGSGLGNVTAYDPVTGHVFWGGPGSGMDRFYEYDPLGNHWIERGDSFGNYHQTAAIDPLRRKFIRVGGGGMREHTITESGTCIERSLNPSGPTNMVGVDYPGFDYDPVSETFVAWHGGIIVYSFTPENAPGQGIWMTHGAGGDNPGSAIIQGTFNRWRYVPSKNIFIVVNSIDGNVFAYRHTEASSAPQWYLDLIEPGSSPSPTLPPVRPQRLRIQ